MVRDARLKTPGECCLYYEDKYGMVVSMPRGRPEPLRDRATAPVVERLRKRLQGAGDHDLELFPAPEDVYGVLLYVREREALLEKGVERLEALPKRDKDEEKRLADAREVLQEHNLDRVRLVRRMRQLVDVEEAAVLEASFRSRLKGRELAKVMGIESRGGAALRLERLRLAITSKWEIRTPRLAAAQAAEAEAENRRVSSAHERVRVAALNLLSKRSSYVDADGLDDWWDDLEWHLDGNDQTPSEQASTAAHVRQIVRDIRTQAAIDGVAPSPDEAAVKFLQEAAEAARRD